MQEACLEITRKEAGPDAALAVFEGEGVALIHTPQKAFFARFVNGALVYHEGQPVNLDRAFEFRLFNEEAELRWRRRGMSGEMVLLKEGEGGKPCWRRETQYLLWGGFDENMDEWTVQSTERIGGLHVPLKVKGKGQRIVLKAREYFTTYEDGNVALHAERLLGLAPGGNISCRQEKADG